MAIKKYYDSDCNLGVLRNWNLYMKSFIKDLV